ncbi:unnamed protein product [Paramecium sonneborni]|uniref:Uncharacterized protein n=1 Tax=Paramecium sonneborni TaxID=65129 RepID=A0A8S1QTU8_9CILI|nr:unnamed protein product [Paramecium sonneborni]
MENCTPKDFRQILSILCYLNNQEINIKSDLSKKKVSFYQESFITWFQLNYDDDLLVMLQFIKDKAFDISQFPVPLQIIIQALIELFYDGEINTGLQQTLLKQFIFETKKNESLKQVIEAYIQYQGDISDEQFKLKTIIYFLFIQKYKSQLK